jgi:23S rRNA pseudoU1915 N3-methylase RlmH
VPRTAKFRPKSFSCKKFSNDQRAPVASRVAHSHTQTTDNTCPYTHNTATMAKTENDIRVKKEKKDKKRKADDEVEDVSEKKDKKKKRKSVDADGDAVMDASVAEIVEAKEEDNEEKAVVAIGALVPFANPLADEKQQKKVLKAVKKCMRRIQADWS